MKLDISAMPASVYSISGISVLGCPPSWSTLKFAACLVVSHSAAHTRGLSANFADTTFAKLEFSVKTLLKVKSVKPTLPDTRFAEVTKSNQDLVKLTLLEDKCGYS
jgi:hypothetical protein